MDILKKDKKWDVIVIGAGMAGLLIGYYLQKEGLDVLIIEANRIASGQTEKTTAKITSQHGIKYSRLIEKVGIEKARIYAQANEEAIDKYEKLIKQEKIDCGFRRCAAYLYTETDKECIVEEADAAQKVGIKAEYVEKIELPMKILAGVRFDNQACFKAEPFVRHIASKLNILENTQVVKIKGNKVYTRDEVFSAEDVVIATHYPIKNVPGFYFLRQHQERSYVLALENCEKVDNMYYGIDKEGISIRHEGEYLLFGGENHRTGRIKNADAYKRLESRAKELFPECRIVKKWSAQDCMPHDGIPFMGKFSMFAPDIYVATGFQKWGMTSSMVAAMILRDEICGRHNHWLETFSPQRFNFRAGIKNFLIDVMESTVSLFKGLLKGRRCSHMGCRLKWNPMERSWDCPCHGSRFDEKGHLIDNPAVDEITIK